MSDPDARPTRGRPPHPDVAGLHALKEAHPELGDAVDLHLALFDLQRRVMPRIPVPGLDVTAVKMARHQAEGRPLLTFAEIPIEMTDLRLLVRQTADVLRRFGALEEADFARVQTLGRDASLVTLAGAWFTRSIERRRPPDSDGSDDAGVPDHLMALVMRPFLLRCAETLQPREELALWTHGHCALCGGEPDLAVITPSADRQLICSQCALRWHFDPLACPFCGNAERRQVTSFATPDGRYRVYGCNVCRRYLKACDARHSGRPVVPLVDGIATLPLDAAAQQRGYNA